MSEDYYGEDSSGFINNEENIEENNSDQLIKASTLENNFFKTEDDLVVKENNRPEFEVVSFCGIASDSQFSAIINLISSAIGGGCLNFPSILTAAGLPLTIFIFFIVTLSVYYTIDLLRSFVVDTKFFSFGTITLEILGEKWLTIYTISSLIFYLSIEVTYLSQIYTILSNLLDFANNYSLLKNIIFFIVSIPLEIFIFLYYAKVQKIHLLTLISCFIFLLIFLIIIITGTTNMFNRENENQESSLIKPVIKDKVEFFFSLMSFFIEYLYGYTYHNIYPTLLSNLKNIDNKSTKFIHNISFIIILIIYFLITFFGHFLKVPMSEILFNGTSYEQVNLGRVNFFRVLICLFLFTAMPIRYIIIRDNYTCLFVKDRFKEISFIKDLIAVILCTVFCNLIVYLTNISIIKFNIVTNFIQLFGGIFGVIICFILPVINYIGVNGKAKVKSIIGYILTFLFSIIGLLSVGHSIHGIFIKNDFENV
jgi:amino acid permease